MSYTRGMQILVNQELFWSNVDQSGGPDACWPCKLKSDIKSGYVRVMTGSRKLGNRKMMLAHVVAFVLTGGDLTKEKPFVLHRCDNPPCCNPAHHFAGNQTDNMRDMAAKGRNLKTHCPKGHPYSGANLYVGSDNHRRCRTCMESWGKVA